MRIDNMEYAVRLFAAMETHPSHSGTRVDGKVCDAKPGECRLPDGLTCPESVDNIKSPCQKCDNDPQTECNGCPITEEDYAD